MVESNLLLKHWGERFKADAKPVVLFIVRVAARILADGNFGDPQRRMWFFVSQICLVIYPFYKVCTGRTCAQLRSILMGYGLFSIKSGYPDFRIELVAEGEEFLVQSLAGNDRLILCTAHFGIGWAVFWGIADYLKQSGHDATLIVNENNLRQTNLNYTVVPSGIKAFVNARSALESGSVICVIPEYATKSGHGVRRNVFGFACRVRASILFFWSSFDQNGRMVIHFVRPVHSTPETNNDADACFDEFGHFIAARTWRTVGFGGGRPTDTPWG
jgi:hypothetical protein